MSPEQEVQIFRGINDIFFHLQRIPTSDVAHFLVEFDPELAGKLADQIYFSFLDKDLKEKRENGTKPNFTI